MSIRHLVHTPATRADLNRAIEHTEPHLRPVLGAVRDLGLAVMFVPQATEPFRIPRGGDRPTLTIVGDDFDWALGPGAFHMPSLRRIIRAGKAFAIVSSAPVVEVYGTTAVTAAVTGVNAVLIETRPEMEIPWLALVQKLAPGRPVWLSTVEGGHA